MTREFDGKVALVTGGSSGIGQATAFAFARAGAKVIVACRHSAEGEKTVDQIKKEGGQGLFIQTDVSKEADVEALIHKTLEVYGSLNCAFNNAGVTVSGSLTELSEEDWNRVIDINLKGMWYCLKHEIPPMCNQGNGAIVNMASVAGVVGKATASIYSASKGGVIALTRTAAIEYAESGIRINTVSPGAIKTPIMENIPEDILTQIVEAHPIKRMGKPEEVAEAVLWLCSEKASFIIGHNLIIDGGYTAH